MKSALSLNHRIALAQKLAGRLYKEIRFLLFDDEGEFEPHRAFHLNEAIDAFTYHLEQEYKGSLHLMEEFFEFQHVLEEKYNHPEAYLDILRDEQLIKQIIVGHVLRYVRF